MALYRYVKQNPFPRVRPPRIVSALFIVVGIGLLGWTVWPIISFSAIAEEVLTKTVSPISDGKTGVRDSIKSSFTNAGQATESSAPDYTNANVWFPTRPQKKVAVSVNSYTISIPKLKIDNAVVTIGGDDLVSSLIHYGGTSLPGQYGNAVIFGHSTLPQFFRPTNYKTIFSTLPTLTKGDIFTITYDGIQYRYKVYDMIVVDPTDLSPLEQIFDDSYVTLVTCVPPGTYWKRLNVKARLSKTI